MNDYGIYDALTFKEVFEDSSSFVTAYTTQTYIPVTLSNERATLLWAELMAKYANSPISSTDIGRFQLQLFCIVHNKGSIWSKRLDMQNELRLLTTDQMISAASNKVVQNRAENPSSYVESGTLEDTLLQQINTQTAQISKASKLSAIASLNMLLEDVTTPFIEEFAKLFRTIVLFDEPALYGNVD